MSVWLKQSTSVTVQFGPFLDKTDGVTLETGLATALDNATTGIRLSKNGGVLADRSSSTVPVYDAMGYYRINLGGVDTNTLGTLRMIFEESATCLPVWQDFMVVPANVWDSLFGADKLQVDLTQISGAVVSTTTAQLGVNTVQAGGTAWGSGAVTAASIATNAFTAAKFATGALTAAKFAAGALDAVWSTATRALTDKAGFSLSTAGILAIWHQPTSAVVTASTMGKLIVDNLNATVSSRMAEASISTTGGTIDSVATVASVINDVNADVVKISGSAVAADTLELSTEAIVSGTAQTGTLSTTAMTTNLTISAASQYNGRIIIFQSDTITAALRNQATDITSTTVANGQLGFTALTTAPVNGDSFIIV